MQTCQKCNGLVVTPLWAEHTWDVYCLNCGNRPLLWHMRDRWEPDGQQVPKLRVPVRISNPLTMSEQIQRALSQSEAALRQVRA